LTDLITPIVTAAQFFESSNMSTTKPRIAFDTTTVKTNDNGITELEERVNQ